MIAWIGIAILLAGALVLLLVDEPGARFGFTDADFAGLVAGIALLVVIGSGMVMSYRGRIGLAVRQAAVWIGVALMLVVIYSYRHEFLSVGQRIAGELVPGVPISVTQVPGNGENGRRVVAIRAERSGYFNVGALVNGTHVDMIADTGATLVVLTHDDARRVGLDPSSLAYTVPMQTANGLAHGALVHLDEVEVGGIAVRRVSAIVSQPDALHRSLLGMSYLKQIGSFQFSGDQLVLRE